MKPNLDTFCDLEQEKLNINKCDVGHVTHISAKLNLHFYAYGWAKCHDKLVLMIMFQFAKYLTKNKNTTIKNYILPKVNINETLGMKQCFSRFLLCLEPVLRLIYVGIHATTRLSCQTVTQNCTLAKSMSRSIFVEVV